MLYIYNMDKSQVILSREKIQVAAKILKVLAHPVKLEILQILGSSEPMDVSTLCVRIGADCEISMMSHHLAKMKDNRILQSEKRGKQVFYSISDKSLLKLIDCLDQCDLI